MRRQDWDERYRGSELVWGTEPNRFVADELEQMAPRGRALDLACGEGRNAIWLAAHGWSVMAVDFSEVALERARRLASRQSVQVDWRLEDVTVFEPPEGAFALVLIAYLQLPPNDRQRALVHAARALCAGGELFGIGHARRNLTEGAGGPRDPAVLWEPVEIQAELETLGLNVQRCKHVRRAVETPEGVREAIDTLVRAVLREVPPR